MSRWRRLTLLLLSIGLIVACSQGDASSGPSPSPAESPSQPANTPISATPEANASPTQIASGNYLEIDGERVLAVLVPSPDLGVEFAVTRSGLYHLEERSTWQRIDDGAPEKQRIADPRHTGTLYRGGHEPCAKGGEPIAFEKSLDGGRNWQTIASGENVRPLLTPVDQPDVVYGERCLLAISTDRGQSWQSYQIVPGFTVASLALRGTRLYSIYTSEGGTSRLIPIDVSDPANPQTDAMLLEFWGSGVALAGMTQLIVGSPEGVRISEDGGQTWDLYRQGLEDVTISVNPLAEPIPQSELARQFGILTLAIHPLQEGRLFAGTVRGLYMSENGGRNWGLIEEIGQVEVRDLTFAFDGGQLYVQTGHGVAVIKNP